MLKKCQVKNLNESGRSSVFAVFTLVIPMSETIVHSTQLVKCCAIRNGIITLSETIFIVMFIL